MLWEYITPSMEASVRFWPIAAYHLLKLNVRYPVRSQPVDATHALNLLAGVSNPNVLRGRSFN